MKEPQLAAFENMRKDVSEQLKEINRRLEKLELKQDAFEKSDALKKENSYPMEGSTGCVFNFSQWNCSVENGKRVWISSSYCYKYKADGANISNLIFHLKG